MLAVLESKQDFTRQATGKHLAMDKMEERNVLTINKMGNPLFHVHV